MGHCAHRKLNPKPGTLPNETHLGLGREQGKERSEREKKVIEEERMGWKWTGRYCTVSKKPSIGLSYTKTEKKKK